MDGHADSRLSQLGLQLGRAWYAYLALLNRVLAEAGLDEHIQPGFGSLLFALSEDDDETMGTLSERLSLSKSTVTRLVRRVEKAGLVETCRDPADRRVIRVRLTAFAWSLQDRCNAVADRMEEILAEELRPRESARLSQALATVTQTIRQHSELVDQQRQRRACST